MRHDKTSEGMSDKISEGMPAEMLDKMSEGTSDKKSEGLWAWVGPSSLIQTKLIAEGRCTMKMRYACLCDCVQTSSRFSFARYVRSYAFKCHGGDHSK